MCTVTWSRWESGKDGGRTEERNEEAKKGRKKYQGTE
jgi:hypothetical protein